MSKTPDTPTENRDTMRPEYDRSGAVRGVTARRYAQGANVVVASPDLLHVFPDGKSVDEALRALAPILRRTNPPPLGLLSCVDQSDRLRDLGWRGPGQALDQQFRAGC